MRALAIATGAVIVAFAIVAYLTVQGGALECASACSSSDRTLRALTFPLLALAIVLLVATSVVAWRRRRP